MGLYELFIDGARLKILDTKVFQGILDYLVKIALGEDASRPMTTRIVIDCLSVIMIHLVVDDSDQLLP